MATPQGAAQLVSIILPFLSEIAGAVTTASKTPQPVADKIQQSLAGVQSGIQALADSETAAQSKPIVQRIEADGMAILQAAMPFVAGVPMAGPLLMGASVLLPSVIAAVNMFIAARTPVPAAPAAA